ncbi:NAD(P)-dependent oxidoreductase [Salinisphaera sp. T31B1]|uniref:NAD(P)-dependent oxidoreductase n=1 Tax=Salinisphaera sp. T31B1 TaxID=727963 RepID=UPI003340602B
MSLIVLIVDLPERYRQRIAERHELVVRKADEIQAEDPVCQRADVVWTNGMVGLSDAAMAALPSLALIVCQGVGYDGVDTEAAQRRGIAVAAGRGVNSSTVADHALALTLALLRRIPVYDRNVRDGHWLEVRRLDPLLTGRRVGILGFGQIGRLIARRAAGFDCEVHYHARRQVADSQACYADSPRALAAACDVLVLCCPGGPATHHIVDATVLAALGGEGVLINVARGSVVDTPALWTALHEGTIAGAALDVIEGEPGLPEGWHELDNVVFTPHTGGLSSQAFDEMVAQGLASVAALGANEPIAGRVV